MSISSQPQIKQSFATFRLLQLAVLLLLSLSCSSVGSESGLSMHLVKYRVPSPVRLARFRIISSDTVFKSYAQPEMWY